MSAPLDPTSARSEPSSRARGKDQFVTQASVMRLSEDEVDAMIETFAKEDDAKRKTWTRILVENYLSKYKWYNPRRDITGAPSLSKAYAYYEHITLPRHFAGDIPSADHVLRRSEPGEMQETELYSPLSTTSSSFIEWGIGLDLYFSTVMIMACILFIAGLLNISNVVYYASDRYSDEGVAPESFSLVGTAICTEREWVVCADCKREDYDSGPWEQAWFATSGDTVLVQRSACDDSSFLEKGMTNYASMLFLGVIMAAISLYLKWREIRFDEDKLTATDYSVIVKNPPPDAYDPDEWKHFFDQFSEKQVTAVTVGLNNEALMNLLLARRIHRHNLRLSLPKGVDLDNEDEVRTAVAQLVADQDAEPEGCTMKILGCTVVPILNLFGMFLPPEVLVDKVFSLTEQIAELQQQKYEASTIFVTFETEEGQRAALDALSVGKIDIVLNRTINLPPSAVFKGRVLKVEEPTEPSAVRWLDLSTPTTRKIVMRTCNLAVTLAVVAGTGWCVAKARETSGPGLSGPLVSVFNSIIPQIVKILMIFERHTTEGGYQTSLYLKITLFRWINTAILTKWITPFTNTLADDATSVLPSINSILWSELWLVPALRLLDIWGNVQKHFFAPRSRTQEMMNLNFQGTFYNLGERYTDLTKVLFLCFFYSALFPSTFFFGAAILVVQYYTDKFCLLRIWAWSPSIGSELARFSRRYFFTGSVLALCMVSAYAWAQFPYDNLCDPITPLSTDVAGTYTNVMSFSNNPIGDIVVTQATPVVACSQSWRQVEGLAFPPTSKKFQPEGLRWMSESQETLTTVYGWSSVGLLIAFLLYYFGSATINFFLSFFRGIYEPDGQDQRIDFSSNLEIFAYVPQIKLKSFPFPLLACNIDKIDQGLIGWNDPTHSYDIHNMIFDVPWEGMPRKKMLSKNTRGRGLITQHSEYTINSEPNENSGRPLGYGVGNTPVFSAVKHYPPPWRAAELQKTDPPIQEENDEEAEEE